jgi:hypothetical protein
MVSMGFRAPIPPVIAAVLRNSLRLSIKHSSFYSKVYNPDTQYKFKNSENSHNFVID